MAKVTNWNDWEKLMHHSFYNELRVTPEEHPIVMIALMLAPEATCTLVGCGRDSGVVLDSGDSVTYATSVLDFIPLNWTIRRTGFCGRDVTDCLGTLLSCSGYEMTTSAEREIVRDIKEKNCYVALDTEMEDSNERIEYELPDGSKMNVGSERYIATEQMFKPNEFGSESPSMQECVCKSIEKCARELRSIMRHNVILCGGNTMFKGFDLRLLFELECESNIEDFKVYAPPERKFLTWIGGSIIGSLSHSNIHNLWISKEQYDDAGATIVHRKIM